MSLEWVDRALVGVAQGQRQIPTLRIVLISDLEDCRGLNYGGSNERSRYSNISGLHLEHHP